MSDSGRSVTSILALDLVEGAHNTDSRTRGGLVSNPAAAKTVRELFDIKGRVAIVSGGSMGLGRPMAQALAGMGATMGLCARKNGGCVQAAEELQTVGV